MKSARAGGTKTDEAGNSASQGEKGPQSSGEAVTLDGGEVFGDEDYQRRVASGTQPDARTRLQRLEEVLVWAYAGDGTAFFPTESPGWYLEEVAETQDEPKRSELLARLHGEAGPAIVTKFLRKLNLFQARIPGCNEVSELPLESIPLCALEALGLPPAEAHDQLKGLEKRDEHLREDPRRYKPRNGRPGPGNPRLAHLGHFLAECCQWDEHGAVTWRDFYTSYRAWCSQQPLVSIGGEPFTKKALSVEIQKSMGVSRVKLTVGGQKVRGLSGIALRKR